MSRFSFFKDLADFFSFKTRSLLAWAVVVSSVAPGMLFWHLPALARSLFTYGYVLLITMAMLSSSRFFVDFARTIFAAFLFGHGYKPVPFSSPEVDALAARMGVQRRAKVYATDNPHIQSAFTNGLTSRVYLPSSWIRSFPPVEIIAVIGHEFGHIKRRWRSALELTIVITASYGFFVFLLQLVDVVPTMVFDVGYIALAFLLASFISWRMEYRADMEGSKATGPEGLISMFEYWKKRFPRDDGSETHPPLAARIKRLEPILDL
jgi:Zn-dependent protease with chaperone function